VPSRYALAAAKDFADRLRSRFGSRVVWVRLYGSNARGDATEDSDVDVLAVIHGLDWREKVEAMDMAFDVGWARGLHLSPMVVSDAEFDRLVNLESRFAANVLREGIAA
jgi:predicted nucleotidyltransferase